jgi:hypothetical protein
MDSGPPNSPEPLCLIVEDLDGSFVVCDSRDGMPLARRPGLRDAAAAASLLNGRYPSGLTPPAADTLAYELAQGPQSDCGSESRPTKQEAMSRESGSSDGARVENSVAPELCGRPLPILARLRRAAGGGSPADGVGQRRRSP